ncbi:arylamine N-acetyltransferase [Metabacillus sp. RGM 3146]|uniref:arylamine N-acetyltransferase n=1 Tax=Metabacillus sp. RGM 3146 TaxID=3401092 RepID=UPI003B9AF84E
MGAASYPSTILIKDEKGEKFLADAGFGARVPMKLIPFSGEEVHSSAGAYRIRQHQTEEGNHLLEMKSNNGEWVPGYAFTPAEEILAPSELETIQQVIHEHEMSLFNKTMLAALRTPEGKMVLTPDSFLKETDGVIEKRPLDSGQSSSLLKEHFGLIIKR